MENKAAFLKLTFAMTIFGTIGIFVKNIPLSASLISLTRAIVGFLFLACIMFFTKKKVDFSAIRRNLVLLLLSGLFIGFNWIFLFESYRYTSVAVSTLCYYMAPIIVIVLSPLVLKEKLTLKKIVCVVVALVGMLFISGVLREDMSSGSHMMGILLGISAAVLYATIMLLNQKLVGINAYERTAFQLGMAGLVLIPYCLLTCDLRSIELTATPIILLLVVGVFHTGFTYYLYFGSMEFLSGQTVAMISYLDPIIAVLLSVFVLKEQPHPLDIPGALLILGAALVSELKLGERKNK